MRANAKTQVARAAAAALLVVTLGAGCASETKTVKSETTQYPTATANAENAPTPVIQQQTTQTTTEVKKEPDGVVSSGAKFVGSVIAFPFRVIGSAVGALF